MHRWIAMAALALAACEPASSTFDSRVSADALAVGKFAGATLSDLEARAKAAGWQVVSSERHSRRPIATMTLELDDGSHFAYVTVLDLPRTSRVGSRAAVAVIGADKLLRELPSSVDQLSREALKTRLERLGAPAIHVESSDEDGVTSTILTAKGVAVYFYEFSTAKSEGRLGVDGHRIMNVFVCKDCTQRNTRMLSEAWQTAKAKVLLSRLTVSATARASGR